MSTAQDARRARIRADQKALEQVDARLLQLRRARQEAQDELAAAQAKFAALDVELEDTKKCRKTLFMSLNNARSAFRRAIWTDVIPPEILRAIFIEIHLQPDDQWCILGHGTYNLERARRPFTLAAVCSRWRKLAIFTSTLWTYIGADDQFCADSDGDLRLADCTRIKTALRRSKAAPIDVLLRWCNAEHHDKTRTLRAAVALIGKHAARLRYVDIFMPDYVEREPLLDFLRAPTPALVRLSVETGNDEWEKNYRQSYLPNAPNLQEMDLVSTGMSCSPRHAGFDSLNSLRLWVTVLNAPAIILLSKAAQTLKELVLVYDAFDHDDEDATPLLPMAFPQLESLAALGNIDLLSYIAPTRLLCLSLLSNEMDSRVTFGNFLQSVSDSVTALTLQGDTTCDEDLELLEPLTNIESLSFSSSRAQEYIVNDNLFLSLASNSPAMWPKLKRLEFKANGSIDPPDSEGLIQLLQSRNAAPAGQTVEHTDDRPCKITEVDLGCKDVPDWVRATVASLL